MTTILELTQQIPIERIADLLSTAFEGENNSWYEIRGHKVPKNFDNLSIYAETKLGLEVYKNISYPLQEGGAILIAEIEEDTKPRWLTLNKIINGIELLAEQYPSLLGDFLDGEFDSYTADIFLQLCLFEEVIYG